MNMFANHGFIARDGITNLAEVTDAARNVLNMAWDLAAVVSLVALTLGDGDIVSRTFSIGCDATNRTAALPLISGSQPGLNGHNNFEADASMGRDDYFLNNGDNYSLNGTKFGMIHGVPVHLKNIQFGVINDQGLTAGCFIVALSAHLG